MQTLCRPFPLCSAVDHICCIGGRVWDRCYQCVFLWSLLLASLALQWREAAARVPVKPLSLAATPRHPEAAWHRRSRKQRSLSRACVIASKAGFDIPEVRVQQAEAVLNSHHGTPKDMGRDGGRKLEWECCKGCKGKDGKAFINRASNVACHSCGVPKSLSGGRQVQPRVPSQRAGGGAAGSGGSGGGAWS